MSWPRALSPVRDLLAELFPTDIEARSIVAEAGIPSSDMSFTSRSLDTWYSILQKTIDRDKLENLLEVAIKRKEGNPTLVGALKHFKDNPFDYQTVIYTYDYEAPNIGEKSYITCDRSQQEFDFKSCFTEYVKKKPGIPQLYLIPGGEDQRHSSLIDRFQTTSISTYIKELPQYGAKKAAIPRWVIEFAVHEDLIESEKQLLFSLFEKCNPGFAVKNSIYSSDNFRELLRRSLYPAIVIEHDIKFAKWNKTGGELMASYLKFLSELQADDSMPQIIVFINVIYPTQRSWRDLLDVRSWITPANEKYEREIRQIFQLQKQESEKRWARESPPCVMLDNLGCVSRDDVVKWFRSNKIGGGRIDPDEWVDGVVKRNECKSMGEIERALIKMLNSLRREQEENEIGRGRLYNL